MFDNNSLSKISPTVRFVVLVLMIISIIIAKSIYLILSITTLILILLLYTNNSLNSYIKFIKKFAFVLTTFITAGIVITWDCSILLILKLIYKVLMILIIIKMFCASINFYQMHEIIYKVILPLKFLDRKKASFNITLYFLFFKYFVYSWKSLIGKDIMYIDLNRKMRYRYLYAACKIKEESLRSSLNFYTPKVVKIDINSKIILVIFVLFFIICVFKEVIL